MCHLIIILLSQQYTYISATRGTYSKGSLLFTDHQVQIEWFLFFLGLTIINTVKYYTINCMLLNYKIFTKKIVKLFWS